MKTLYKKTSSGKVQQWSIDAILGTITVVHGEVGGKMQTDIDTIKAGKNIGKANETTVFEQAKLEAAAKYEKQKKKGYVESLDDAQAGKVDKTVITGGVSPMLAQSFAKHGDKIKLPCYAQPKLDGIRCIAIVKGGKATLWTRTRKPIKSMPHIQRRLEEYFGATDVVVDGELYNHDYRNDFEQIVSLVRQEVPAPGHEKVQYHVYDIVDPTETFDARALRVIGVGGGALVSVPTTLMDCEEDALDYLEVCQDAGYEGIMLRNRDSKYEIGKRSYNLQKVKEFIDSEFPIVGVEEGRGKMAGKAIFVCKAKNGETFKVKMEGSIDNLAQYLTNKKLWTGKKLTVKYQNLTKYGIPRFPVGKAVRDYE